MDFATVDQLARDEQCFDGFADADIIGDKEPDGIELERHKQGNKLIGARLDVDIAETAEGAGAGAELQTECIPQKKRGFL